MGFEDIVSLEGDGTCGCWEQAEEGATDGGLSTARFPDQTECLALSDGEGDAIDGFEVIRNALKESRTDREVCLEPFDLEQRLNM